MYTKIIIFDEAFKKIKEDIFRDILQDYLNEQSNFWIYIRTYLNDNTRKPQLFRTFRERSTVFHSKNIVILEYLSPEETAKVEKIDTLIKAMNKILEKGITQKDLKELKELQGNTIAIASLCRNTPDEASRWETFIKDRLSTLGLSLPN